MLEFMDGPELRVIRRVLIPGLLLLGMILAGSARAGTDQSDLDEAWAAYDRGDYKAAQQLFRLEADRGNADAQYMVAEIYEEGRLGAPDYAAAARWYEKAVAQGLPEAETSLGYLYDFGLGVARDQAKAEALYESAALAGNVTARNNIAYEWAQSGKRLGEALDYAREVAREVPDNGAFQDTLGWVLYRLDRLGEALPRLCEAAKLDPGSPEILAHLGDAFWRAGLAENARMQWRQAYELADGEFPLTIDDQHFLHAEGEAAFKAKMQQRLAEGPPGTPAPDGPDRAAIEKAINGGCDLPIS
jgi:TPR repeat protein